MCGIVGYKGARNVKEVLIKGLRALEYRGYDSSGVALLDDGEIKIVKSVGKIDELEKKLNKENINKPIMGIAHTRWATHGKVNEKNSHPHKLGRVVLVHNGIIENYKEIEKKLIEAGYKFETDTDTEMIAGLIDLYYNGKNEIEAIQKAVKELRGSFAILVMFSGDSNNIYGIKNAAPLILGVGENENFLASDISAILSYTRKFIILDDNEIVKLNENKYEIYHNDKIINKNIEEATWSIMDAEKQGYEHFMLKEINEQTELANKLYAKYTPDNKITDDIIDITKYKEIDIVACGSAYYAGLIGKSLIDKYLYDTHIKCDTTVASEYRYKPHVFDKNKLVIVISQSGETADTLASLRLANKNNVDTLAIVNVTSSTIAREAKYIIPMLAGPEISVATTKGYFSQSYIMSLLILKAMHKLKKLNETEITNILKETKDLNKLVSKVIENQSYKEIAKSIYEENDMYYIGRGIDSEICEEASLKLKEISYIHSECFKAGELKHGPIALLTKDTPVICILTEDDLVEKTLSNLTEASSRGAKTILITKNSINTSNIVANYIITVPTTTPFMQNLLIIVVCQLLAYEIARLRGCEIDKPKNLAKSVTVE